MQSCLGSSGLGKAAVEVELEMPLAVNTSSSPHAVPLGGKCLLCSKLPQGRMPGSVVFILKCSEIVSEGPPTYSLGNFSILS